MKKAARPDLPAFEAEMLKVWDAEKAFQKSLELRKSGKRFRFFDGPPFANGEPHYGHIEQAAIKDAIARYKTMRGYYVPRRLGYDTHGLPVEFAVEKELGFKNKQDIIDHGVDKFIEACRAVVFKHRGDFERMHHRIGRWAGFDDTYATLDQDYMESVWWVFGEIYKKGLVYQGFKSLPYCPRCATPLSNFEMNDGYKDDVMDPSFYVKFKLRDEDAYMLAWTTTPWSLPGNVALAVQAEADYATVEVKGHGRLILAKDRLEVLDLKGHEFNIESTRKGRALVGLHYEPLYEVSDEPKAYAIYDSKEVSLEDGTGILHVAPAFGEVDLAFGQEHGLPVLSTLDPNGKVIEGPDEAKGRFFKDADKPIIADLTKRGLDFAAEYEPHTYPFCWRCETPLFYYAISTWFVEVTKIREQLVEAGKETTWTPGHVKTGRFVKWLEGARDWAISRNRFWGTPIPIWRCGEGHDTVLSSVEQLEKLSGRSVKELHKPYIDEVKIKCGECGKEATRIEEVFDCWFESGSMPYGQDHYPFENKVEFDASFPADFIVEAIEQVHLWFYTLHVLGVALFDKPAYTNVVATGLILAADGRKLSKRLKNFPPVEELFEKYGADSVRFFLLSSPLMYAEATRLDQDAIRDVERNVFLTLWNTHSFLTTYAEIDKWEPPTEIAEPKSDNLLDQWIVSRLNQTISEVTKQAEEYQIAAALRPIQELIDDLSNWYVRRSRRRFWKSESDSDKNQAYATLHFVLAQVCQIMAPWSPFVTDQIFRNLTNESVHFSNWPEAGRIDDAVIEQMDLARKIVQEGLAQRGEAKIKVRQPLAKLEIIDELPEPLRVIIAEEVNVKEVITGKALKLDTELTDELKAEGLAREVIRHIQQLRKELDLKVDDRINLSLSTKDGELKVAINSHLDLIKSETLAAELSDQSTDGPRPVAIDGKELEVGVERAS